MPTYDYECKACGHTFDELQSFSEPPLTKCPACKKNKLERLFGGGGGVIFKGSGFYEADYRRAGSHSNGEGKGDGGCTAKTVTAAETKSEAKAEAPAAPAESSPSNGKPAGKGGAKKKG